MSNSDSILLVIPCWRESARLPSFLNSLCHELDAFPCVQVLVVDDGSDPQEKIALERIVTAFRESHRCLLPPLLLPTNLGKGGAVYAGWEHPRQSYKWLGFVDADGSCSPQEVVRMIRHAKEFPDSESSALFASRVKMLGRNVNRLFKRHLLGRVYATLVSEILSIPVYDSQCGLKLVPKRAYERIASRLKIMGFAFDVELMVALLDSGCAVEEFPIDWHETPGGKVHLVRDSYRMFRDVFGIKQRRHKSS